MSAVLQDLQGRTVPHPHLPFDLRFTREESLQAGEAWGANCGPHSIAAALGMSLQQVRQHLDRFPGWMSPTMMSSTLRTLGVAYGMRMGLKTHEMCQGINRIQWEGSWLNPGVPIAAAYGHTHWVAHFHGLVLCTYLMPWRWITFEQWRDKLAERREPWHITHYYRMAPRAPGEDPHKG